MNENLIRILKHVRKEKQLIIRTNSWNDANNRRQRFYRLREQIRAQDHELKPDVDNFSFKLQGAHLRIEYDRRGDQQLLETINDDERSSTNNT